MNKRANRMMNVLFIWKSEGGLFHTRGKEEIFFFSSSIISMFLWQI